MAIKNIKLTSPSMPTHLAAVESLDGLFAYEDSAENALFENLSFHQSTLKNFSIAGSRINKIDFSGTEIDGFSLKNVIFHDCDMTAARFARASWQAVEVQNSRCSGMQLNESTLKDVLFKDCKLDIVNFRFTKLTNVVFHNCIVNEMDFYNAELKNVAFINCEINTVEFLGARLQNVNLTESILTETKRPSSLKGAAITSEQLVYLAPYFAAELGIHIEDQV